jgi:hypothetical protein
LLIAKPRQIIYSGYGGRAHYEAKFFLREMGGCFIFEITSLFFLLFLIGFKEGEFIFFNANALHPVTPLE